MTQFVLDTSALIRLYLPDGELPEGLSAAVDAAWRGDARLLAPELMLAEAGQVLRKKEGAGLLSAEEVDEVLQEVLGLPVHPLAHAPLLSAAVALARRTELTVYDALFLQAALRHRATLLTADKQLRATYERLAAETR